MTNPTQHRQVPDALRLAEEITNLECSSEAVAKTIAAAADELCRLHVKNASLSASPTPPAEQAAPKAEPGVGNSGFDYKTAADFLNGKTVSDEAVRKFVAASRWAHDERAALSATLLAMHGVLTSREAEIALLKKALLEAEAAPQQQAQPGAVYAELPEEHWLSTYTTIVWNEDSMRDFADRTHALRMEQAVPKAAPGEPSAHQILAITTAYEQGVGKGHQAYNSGKEIANPYDSAYRCDLAWQYGYGEGKEQAQREAKAAPQQEAQEPFGWVKSSEIESARRHGGSINLWRIRYDCDTPLYLEAPRQEAQEPIGHLRMGPKEEFVATKRAEELDIDVWHPVFTAQPAPQQEAPLMPKGESAASKLRAMAANYPEGHLWDKLDAQACAQGAMEIEALRAAPQQEPASPIRIGWGRDYQDSGKPVDASAAPVPDFAAILQQEAQEPVAWLNPWRADQVTTDYDAYGERGIPLYTSPNPAPAPLSERDAFEAWIKKDGGDLSTFGTPPNMHYRNSAVNNAWVAWKARAVLAAQGGKDAE